MTTNRTAECGGVQSALGAPVTRFEERQNTLEEARNIKDERRRARRQTYNRLIRTAAQVEAQGDRAGAQQLRERAAKVLADLQLVG